MLMTLQISQHGIAHSPALYNTIRARAEKLEQYYSHLVMSCRVVLELVARHPPEGRRYVARIGLKVPGGELAVTHEHGKDLQVALRAAFAAARRRVEDYASRQRRGARSAPSPA